jgi:hypothetical protein
LRRWLQDYGSLIPAQAGTLPRLIDSGLVFSQRAVKSRRSVSLRGAPINQGERLWASLGAFWALESVLLE